MSGAGCGGSLEKHIHISTDFFFLSSMLLDVAHSSSCFISKTIEVSSWILVSGMAWGSSTTSAYPVSRVSLTEDKFSGGHVKEKQIW